MFHTRFAATLPLLFAATLAVALPDESEFRVVDNIPQPAPFGTGIVGCSIPDGRYLVIVLVRLFAATLFGAAIGFERESAGKAAGLIGKETLAM